MCIFFISIDSSKLYTRLYLFKIPWSALQAWWLNLEMGFFISFSRPPGKTWNWNGPGRVGKSLFFLDTFVNKCLKLVTICHREQWDFCFYYFGPGPAKQTPNWFGGVVPKQSALADSQRSKETTSSLQRTSPTRLTNPAGHWKPAVWWTGIRPRWARWRHSV